MPFLILALVSLVAGMLWNTLCLFASENLPAQYCGHCQSMNLQWIGKNHLEVVKKLGVPSQKSTYLDGEYGMWVYNRSKLLFTFDVATGTINSVRHYTRDI